MPDNSLPVERLTLMDKVNVLLEDFGDHYMHWVFDIPTEIDVTRLNRAVRLSLIAHPLMAHRLIYGVWYPKWKPWSAAELDGFDYCEMKQVSSPEEREKEVQGYLSMEMDFYQRPLVHVRIVRGEGYDTVCVKVSCIPIDGRAFNIYMNTLVDIYNRLQSDPDYMPEPGTMANRSTKALLPLFGLLDAFRVLVAALMNQATDTFTARNWQLPVRETDHLDRHFYCHHFQESTMKSLHEFRKRHGLSFNDMILGAYYLALYEIIKPEKPNTFCVLNTFDLRRYEGVDAPHRVANYSSFINTNVALDDTTTLLQAAQRVRKSVNQRKGRYPGITEGPFIWPIMTLLPFALARRVVAALLKHRGECIPVLTNVGLVDLSMLKVDGHIMSNIRPFPPLEYPPKLAVSVITSGGILNLSAGYSRSHLPEGMVQQLFRRMEEIIMEACAKG